ncbi:hypothetical protein LARV_01586 [Longilinea arvoryzae]|uniref:Uncharacterized protein n=1 Tax=Longilinea arvoryzae TaxID=360412 RepID=A0A0S7BH25_9CHLR|nr:hypothetical protein LARV_01586 [Longilinea arvoryzae]
MLIFIPVNSNRLADRPGKGTPSQDRRNREHQTSGNKKQEGHHFVFSFYER